MAAPVVTLNNGYSMPAIGFGTCAMHGEVVQNAVKHAIDVGYRHIDTAWAYENEKDIGRAIQDKINEGVVRREDLFITNKLWNTFHEPDRVEYICRKSLQNMGLEYFDVYLIHFPFGYKYTTENEQWPRNSDGSRALSNVDFVDTWSAMEKLVEKNLVKSIGVSNFNRKQIDRLLSRSTIKPVVNQVECSATINQRTLNAFCAKRGIQMIGFCPLGHPSEFSRKPSYMVDSRVRQMVQKYKKTPVQIALRYLHQMGVTPIPKSARAERIRENLDIFKFQLDDHEMSIMDSFNTGIRLVQMHDAKKSPYWPYGEGQ